MNGRTRLVALALLSGLTGLGSETVFFKLLDFTVGSAALVAFTVVATFILGVGLSSIVSPKVKRPWIAEALLFVYNLGWFFGFDAILWLNGRVIAALSTLVGPNAASSLAALVYLAPPALLLGVSFPAVIERSADLARPYLVQSLGAAIGIVLVEGILFPRFGLFACLLFLATSHLLSAMLLFRDDFVFSRRAFGRVRAALVIAGVATGAFQGIWLFLAQLLFQPFYFVQPIVVFSMLVGIAIGSFAWLRLARRAARPGELEQRAEAARIPSDHHRGRIRFSTVVLFALCGASVSTLLVVLWLKLPQSTSFWAGLLQIPVLLLPAAIPIGALLPAYFQDCDPNRTESGAAFFSIALGNALGVVLAGGGLLGFFAPTASLLGPAVVLAVLFALLVRRISRWWGVAIPVAAIFLSAIFTGDEDFIRRLPEQEGQSVVIERAFRGPAELTATYRVYSARTHAQQRRLYQSGFSPIYLDDSPEALIGAVGASYAKRSARALVLGAGSGKSAAAIARVFLHTDVVDIGVTVPALLEALADENDHFLERSTVSYYAIDGVIAPWVLKGPYDLVVLTVDPGYHTKAAKLYTLDFFESLKRLLAPDGVFVLWSDSMLDAEANQVLINTAKAAFRNQKLFAASERGDEVSSGRRLTYYFLVQSDAPLTYEPGRLLLPLILDADPVVQRLPGFRFGGEAKESDRLIEGRAHPTDRIHALAHPAPSILFGGYHQGPVAMD